MSNVVALAPRRADEPVEEVVSGFEDMPSVMSPKTLADYLDLSVKTLERMRDAKTGPAWHKLPGSSLIRYSRTDVLTWFAACRQGATY